MPAFDAFISYSRADQDAVVAVAEALRERGLKPFLDRWHLAPGKSWPELLEENLASCKSVVVFVGPSGLGGWQKREIYRALDRQVGEEMPVIPVLLPGTEDPALGFLSLNTWVDLRGGLLDEGPLDILAKAIGGEAPGPAEKDTRAEICPYRGLEPFREEDAPFFFGRDSFTELLLNKVEQHSLVAVVGASGSGKSSVVRAGLVPALRRSKDVVWDIETFVPGTEPLEAMIRALDPPEADLGLIEYRAKLNAAADMLRQGQVTLAQLATDFLVRQPGTERLLLVIDQFEELVTLCRDDNDRTLFIDQVLAATADDGPLKVVITLRSDFYTEFVRRRDMADRMQDGVVNIGPLNRDVPEGAAPGTLSELEETVRRPAAAVGLEFEDGLVSRILSDVGDEPGNLPLLEYLLTELWRRRSRGCLTHAAYDELGGVPGAIARRAEEAFSALDDDAKAAARRLFLSLVRPGEGQHDTRARSAFPKDPVLANVARHFSDPKVRLLVSGNNPIDGRTVEVSHEALIRNWAQLRGWVNTNRELLRIRKRVLDRMQQWEENDQRDASLLPAGLDLEEGRRLLRQSGDVPVDSVRTFIERSIAHHTAYKRKRATVRFWTVAGSIAAALLMAFSAGAAIWLRTQAVEAEERALEAQEQAEQSEILAHSSRDEAHKARKEAIAASETALAASQEAKKQAAAAQAARVELLERIGKNRVQEAIVKALYFESGTFQARFRAHQARDLSRSGNDAAALTVALRGMPQRIEAGDEGVDNADGILAAVPELPAALSQALRSMRLKHLWRHSGKPRVRGHDLSPDGQAVAIGFADKIVVRDIETGAERQRFDAPDGDPFARQPVYAPVGNMLAAVTRKGVIHVWRVDLGSLQTEIRLPTPRFGTMAFSPDGASLVITDYSQQALVFDVFTGKKLRTLAHVKAGTRVLSTDRIRSAEFIGDGSRILTRSLRSVRIWQRSPDVEPVTITTRGVRTAIAPDGEQFITYGLNLATVYQTSDGKRIRSIRSSRAHISHINYAPDGQHFLVADVNGRISIKTQVGRTVSKIRIPASDIVSVTFSPDGQKIIAIQADGSVWVWNAKTGARAWRQRSGERLGIWDEQTSGLIKRPPASAVVTSDGAHIVSLSQRGNIRVWRADDSIGPRIVPHKKGSTPAIAMSADGTDIITATKNKVRLIDRATGQSKLNIGKTGSETFSTPVAHSGTRLAFVGKSTGGLLLDTLNGERRTVRDQGGKIISAVFARKGKILMTATNKSVRLWDSQALKVIDEWSPDNPDDVIRGADVARDGSIVAIAEKNGVLLWRPGTGPPERISSAGSATIYRSVKISADGLTVAALPQNGNDRFMLFDTVERRLSMEPVAPERTLESLTFSHNGAFVLAGLSNGELWVYETSHGALVDQIRGHTDSLTNSAVSADGRFVATASRDGTVRIWRQYERAEDLYAAAEQALAGLDLLNPLQECALYLRLSECW